MRRDRERAGITAQARAFGICELRGYLFDCEGGIEVHEVLRRSHADTAADRRFQARVCAAHHELDRDREHAERVGLRVPEWVWRQFGMKAIVEARRIRAALFMGRAPDEPFWIGWMAEDQTAGSAGS